MYSLIVRLSHASQNWSTLLTTQNLSLWQVQQLDCDRLSQSLTQKLHKCSNSLSMTAKQPQIGVFPLVASYGKQGILWYNSTTPYPQGEKEFRFETIFESTSTPQNQQPKAKKPRNPDQTLKTQIFLNLIRLETTFETLLRKRIKIVERSSESLVLQPADLGKSYQCRISWSDRSYWVYRCIATQTDATYGNCEINQYDWYILPRFAGWSTDLVKFQIPRHTSEHLWSSPPVPKNTQMHLNEIHRHCYRLLPLYFSETSQKRQPLAKRFYCLLKRLFSSRFQEHLCIRRISLGICW